MSIEDESLDSYTEDNNVESEENVVETMVESNENKNKKKDVLPRVKFEKIVGSDVLNRLPEPLNFIREGYQLYAQDLVVDRALPSIDGLKPAQRRILYVMEAIEHVKSLRKCGDIAGSTMKIHAHGDASIYETLVRLVHSAEYMNIPYIHGKGSFGKVYSKNARAAAPRYTECMFERVAQEFFKDMDGVDLVPSYNNEFVEPKLLPVTFPTILCNPSQGIAIGIASNMPSFNFHEVIAATIEYLKTGEIKTLLKPDFPTYGCYIEDKHELENLMQNGKARLKLRGKWHIEGKIIVIDEIPFYTNIEDIMSKAFNISGVEDVKDECDKEGLRVTIECVSRKVVDSVLNEVIRVTNLQMSTTTNMTMLIDGKPVVLGVYGIIKEWVKFRESVKEKQINTDIAKLKAQIEKYDILVDLMTTDKREPFMQTLLKEGKDNTKDLLRRFYPTSKEEIFDWILDKSLGSLAGIGNKQISYLEELKVDLKNTEEKMHNIPALLISELEAISAKYKYPRKTEIVGDDYVFDKSATKKVVESIPVVFQIQGKFIKKLKATPTNLTLDGAYKVQSEGCISLLDNKGRLLRVYMNLLPLNTSAEKGTYLPLYLEDKDDDDFEIVDIQVVEDKKTGYIYRDGYIAVVDFNEWMDSKRKTKSTPLGVAPKFIDLFQCSVDLDGKDVLVMKSRKGKLAVVAIDFIIKSRKARTKLIHVGKGDEIKDVIALTNQELDEKLPDSEKYKGHFRVVSKKDGIPELFE